MLSNTFNIKHLFAKKNNAVSALVLTIGEPSFQHAHQSLLDQSIQLKDIVVVENLSPFSQAFNHGVSQIKTPFFIQCDADMVLDAKCVEILLSKMREKTAIVAAYLRDPLQGPTMGVKLYRTAPCKLHPHQNSLSCETEFKNKLKEEGWLITTYEEETKQCLGSHRTDLSDLSYLFERFKLLGAKVFHRKSCWDFVNRFLYLAKFEDKAIASLLSLAMMRGLFLDRESDELGILKQSEDYEKCSSLLKNSSFKAAPNLNAIGNLEKVFTAGFKHAQQTGEGSLSFQGIFTKLISENSNNALIFLMGIICALAVEGDAIHAYRRLRFLIEYIEKKFSYHLSIL